MTNCFLILSQNFSASLFHMLNYKIAIARFVKKLCDTMNMPKTYNCMHNLSPMTLKGNQMVYLWNYEIHVILPAFCQYCHSSAFTILITHSLINLNNAPWRTKLNFLSWNMEAIIIIVNNGTQQWSPTRKFGPLTGWPCDFRLDSSHLFYLCKFNSS